MEKILKNCFWALVAASIFVICIYGVAAIAYLGLN